MEISKPKTIARAAKAAGVGVETIRFYERKGLIEQPRRHNGTGYRVYPNTTVQRIRTIQQAQTLGFSLVEIKDLLALNGRINTNCDDVRNRADAKLAEVRDKINNLQRIESALQALIAACPEGERLDRCPILQALGNAPDETLE